MRQALYRKYRSKSFDEVVGQEHITETLKNALSAGKLSHAYLFSGPRGVGKTSVARILAHEANQFPYKDETVHLDIIEIDAASNRRIDEIRDLREKVHMAPTTGRYKVYIIDEVHMLTKEAFNALLKTLEEPPSHCLFVLATTEAHKLPETIISRTQRFEFKQVPADQIAAHLKKIAKREKIDISDEALILLAEHSGGSFRDSIGLLDQLSSAYSKISESGARQTLGLPPQEAINNLISLITDGDALRSLSSLTQLQEQGINAVAISKMLGSKLRQQATTHPLEAWILPFLKQLLAVTAHPKPYDYLEIAILEAASQNLQSPSNDPVSLATVDEYEKLSKPAKVDKPRQPASPKAGSFTENDWGEILEVVKTKATALYRALRLAIPRMEANTLTLYFQFPLHQKKANQLKQRELIGRLIEEKYSVKLEVKCAIDKDLFESPSDADVAGLVPDDEASLNTISNIFGHTEVLES
ncbi:MAG: DNA polymerase III subunit gamma/tau [Candidatus Saccharimonadales bacterium]